MAALMVLAVANGGETLLTVEALVRLLTGVGPHVYQKIAFFCEDLSTVRLGTFEQVLPRMSRLEMKLESGGTAE
jgi:hypothetical protein